MKEQLTADQIREFLAYDPETGEFRWKQNRGHARAEEKAGNLDPAGHVKIRLCGTLYHAHRLAWLLHYGEWPIRDVWHDNENRSDNRIVNLSLAYEFVGPRQPYVRKKRGISLEELRDILHYCPDTGEFTWKISRRSVAAGDRAGHEQVFHNGSKYLTIRISGVLYLAHRLAWWMHYGEEPEGILDHKNGNGLSNWIDNLRPATHSQNMQNKKLASHNKSGYKGVHLDKKSGKWLAKIKSGGVSIVIGAFDSPQDAHTAYFAAAQEMHGEFARAA